MVATMPYILEDGRITTAEGINGTSLVGSIDVSYADLVTLFGEPDKGDEYKTDAEWILGTPCGVATIYNYKDGRNYLGAEGTPTEDIRDWHIGGRSPEVVRFVRLALSAHGVII